MKTYIILFRGINVGGNHILPMKTLSSELTEMGLRHVQTYIQSGNVICQSDRADMTNLTVDIRTMIEAKHGFRPGVLLLSLWEFQAAAAANPFRESGMDPKTVHLFFLSAVPTRLDIAALEAARINTERYLLTDRVLYLSAPDGIGRSRLAATVEKALGVPVTARNWRTVNNLLALAGKLPD